MSPIYGKTGMHGSRTPTHLGWFGSFTEVGKNKLVVVVLLTGGNAVSGPAASGVAGEVTRPRLAGSPRRATGHPRRS
jgi:beta-lactamase class D